jgi:hypothetical protein
MGNVHQKLKNVFAKVAGLVPVVAKHYVLRTVTTTVDADQLMVLKTLACATAIKDSVANIVKSNTVV